MRGLAENLCLILGLVFDPTRFISKYSQSSHTSNVIEGHINVFYFISCKTFDKEFSTHLSNKTQAVCQYSRSFPSKYHF